MANGPEHEPPAPPPRPTGLDPEQLGFTPAKPVAWLSPLQLAGTGVRVALASIQGGYLDKRELQAAFPDVVHHETASDGDLWLDFVADLGDGFDATYSIAYLLAQPQLTVAGRRLPRGRVLLLGGDEVYPTPSTDRYEDRLIGPYRAAMPACPPGDEPRMYAIPGNHDWYDGLTAFQRIFTGSRSTHIGGWALPQARSYFAIELPGDWWLLALDDEASSYIDDPQLAYFTRVAQRFGPHTNVIVAPPSPTWVQAHDNPKVYGSLDHLLRTIVEPTGAQVRLMVSGDWHHYARYTSPGRELITSGGGGAYLYPTHQLPEQIEVPPPAVPTASPRRRYDLVSRFPTKLRSQGYAASIFGRLPRHNPSFIAMLGAVHTAMMLATSGVIRSDFGSPLQKFALTPLVVLALGVLAGTYAFAHLSVSVTGRTRRRVAGVLHGVAQLALAGAGTTLWWASPAHAWPWPWSLAGALTVYGVLSGLAATELVAVYLLLAARFDVNLNELFSAQGIVDAKSFLRLHFAADGTLTVYPIGVRRIARDWRPEPGGEPHEPWLSPEGSLRTHLVEEPIVLRRTTTRSPAARDGEERARAVID